MINRRSALQRIILASGATALTPGLFAQQIGVAGESEGVFKLPPLDYDYDALEPFIDAETMKIHHDKHHAAYVARLNQLIATLPVPEKRPIEEILGDLGSLPAEIRDAVRDNGGGHANHSLFWKSLKKGKAAPAGNLATAMINTFGDLQAFETEFAKAALSVFGSGWSWLVLRAGKLALEATANQDSPAITGGKPLLGLDMWEHAYYLKYESRRLEYVKAYFQVIDWEAVGARYDSFAQA